MSHFATAEDPNQGILEEQVDSFKDMYNTILEYGHAPQYRHIGNSAATLALDSEFFDAWRPGLALYGYNPLPAEHPKFNVGEDLKPALDVCSKVVAVHDIKTGDGASYNFTW